MTHRPLNEPYGPREAERTLKRMLAELHIAYQREAAPIIRELAHLEAMKPARPMMFDMARMDPELLRQLSQHKPIDPAHGQAIRDRYRDLEHERQLLLRVVRLINAAGVVPDYLAAEVRHVLEDLDP